MKNIKKLRLASIPSLIVLLSWFIMNTASYPYDDFPTFIIVAYILSMSLLVAWVKYNLESLVFLAVGFAVPPLFMLVFEFFNGGFLQYLVTCILALTYSLPFVILTAIIIIISKKVKQKIYIPLLTTTVLILAVPCLFLLIILLIRDL